MNRISLIFLALFVSSCINDNSEKAIIDFGDGSAKSKEGFVEETSEIYIAIASMTSPKETVIYYNNLIDHISEKLDVPIFIKQKKTYQEVNSLLKSGEVDFAFICSGAYVEQNKNIQILVVPEIDGKTDYNAYIIAQKDSEIETFLDFKGASFAFTDPLSNTGRLYPLKELAKLSVKEDSFFKKTIYTYGHDISIQMVNRGIIDGASVHGIIFDYIALHHPERVANIKIIEKSENFGMPPVVVPNSLSKEKFLMYQSAFLKLHEDSLGLSILEKLGIDKFTIVDESIYKSVFSLKELIEYEQVK